MNMEEQNYWNDHRVRAGMINKGKLDGDYLILEREESDDIKLLCKLDVCSTCNGKGTHVNPSIDASGISEEDFDEDPEFRENYMSGMYDQTCNECNGLRVVPVVDRDKNSSEDLKRYDNHLEEEYRYAAEVAAERRMGA